MRKLDPPFVKNRSLLKRLAQKSRRPGRDQLRASLSDILRRYALARAHKCDEAALGQLNPKLDEGLALDLNYYYERPIKGFEFISEVRDKLSPEVCPMCGSLAPSGTVDHVLTRASYPEFSLFSYNLVPACGCNSRRRGDPQHPPLHPYFDRCLSGRLVTSNISGDYDSPDITVVPLQGFDAATTTKVLRHIQNVVNRNNIRGFLDKQWGRMIADPARWLGIDPPFTPAAVEAEVRRKRDGMDYQTGTPNNWYSIFYSGVLAPEVVLAVCRQLSGVDSWELGPI